MTLRPADETDAPTIVFLMHTAFQEYATTLDPPSGVLKETEAIVRDKMQAAHWLIAEQDGKPVGCVFYDLHADYAYLGRLAVLPENRGHGIASALTEAVEQQAVAANLLRVRLGARIALPHLIALYERRGYRIIAYETHPGYAEPTYVTMEKVLAGNAPLSPTPGMQN